MYIVSFFTKDSLPIEGLTPTIKIISVPGGVLLVNNDVMTELQSGFYYYDFVGYEYNKDYAIVCDGGIGDLPVGERFVFAGNENYHEDIDNIISNNALLKRMVGLMHENIYIDNPIYDKDSNLVNARVRIYSDPGSIGTPNNIIGSYLISSTGEGPGKFTNWSQIKL